MDNLAIYNAVRVVPPNAQKSIGGGRLKGMTDINPMFRIKTLTEQFGPCGIGWKYTITDKRLEPGANDEIVAFVDISLHIKVDGEWSEAIPGTGGSMFVAKERSGLYTSDEAYKMALTDALSVACKALGVGADIYWDADRTKYSGNNAEPPKQGKQATPKAEPPKLATPEQMAELKSIATETGQDLLSVMKTLKDKGLIDNKYYDSNGKKVLSAVDTFTIKARLKEIDNESTDKAS